LASGPADKLTAHLSSLRIVGVPRRALAAGCSMAVLSVVAECGRPGVRLGRDGYIDHHRPSCGTIA